MVDIVGANARAHQLLEKIRLLVAALGGTEAGQRFRALRVANLPQLARRQIERFLPRRLAEDALPIVGVDGEIRRFRRAGLAHERGRQPLLMMHVVETIAPLDAQAAFVGGTVAALDAQNSIVLDVISELATDAAIRADRIDRGIGGDEPGASRGHQRAGRASLHAFAAGHARALAHRVAQVEHDL